MKKSLLFMATIFILNAQHSFAKSFELFDKLDTNKDKKISSQEFSNIKATPAKLIRMHVPYMLQFGLIFFSKLNDQPLSIAELAKIVDTKKHGKHL